MADIGAKMKKKHPGGAPPSFVVTDEIIQQAYELACDGKTNGTIAQALGCRRDKTFEPGELCDAIKKGRLEALKRVEQTAYDIAIKDRNPPMCMFLLKCKAGYREKQEIDVNHSYKPIVITKLDGSTIELSKQKKQQQIEQPVEAEIVEDEDT